MPESNNASAGATMKGSASQGSSSSEAEDHFSDASEGRDDAGSRSPIPITRVERVDDRPAHGEVPGTEAFKIRQSDADPDELAVIPDAEDGNRSLDSNEDTSQMPGGKPVPTTVVEKVDPDTPSHGEVPGTHAYDLRQADTAPDRIVDAPKIAKEELAGLPVAIANRSQIDDESQLSEIYEDEMSIDRRYAEDKAADADEEDDFDDFEEGADFDDFGDFNGEFEKSKPETETKPIVKSNDNVNSTLQDVKPPIISYRELHSVDEIHSAIEPYMCKLFPKLHKKKEGSPKTASSDDNILNTVFQTERSKSLWSQLVAPPSLNPPNWIKSRTRRLFLVSLGVPVDLDEILPASKQRKLILPSMTASGERSPRPWAEERGTNASAHAKQKKQSATWADSSSARADRLKEGSTQPPEFDIGSVSIVCSITEAALGNFTDEELAAHVEKLQRLRCEADEALGFWTKRRDQAVGEKEAFEAVIENLVTHAKKARR